MTLSPKRVLSKCDLLHVRRLYAFTKSILQRTGFGKEIVYKYGKVFWPKDYKTKEEYATAITDEFVSMFEELYNAPPQLDQLANYNCHSNL
jgi:hypothetical protein